jgi:hypothetical protein
MREVAKLVATKPVATEDCEWTCARSRRESRAETSSELVRQARWSKCTRRTDCARVDQPLLADAPKADRLESLTDFSRGALRGKRAHCETVLFRSQ